jgi:hypothetical protein
MRMATLQQKSRALRCGMNTLLGGSRRERDREKTKLKKLLTGALLIRGCSDEIGAR